MRLCGVACFILLAAFATADVYMQNPRGSNDRLNEANTNRNNGNRLMDTQNNAKGGYCWGPSMSFYERSMLTIEWTAQHGCGNPAMRCNIVLQYMCSASDADPTLQVRDGTTTDTIPATTDGVTARDDNGELKFGMHENLDHYTACSTRERNQGLFVADRVTRGQLNGKTAIFTRQNNNGNRNGLECAEERDYYPYWHPSPWKDIAVLTDDTGLCDFFKSESQNSKSKNYCQTPDGKPAQFNNERACVDSGNSWVEVPSWGIGGPDCVKTHWSRDNHLGNVMGGYTASYNWTIPTSSQEDCISGGDDGNCNCVLRLRYNISTSDIRNWDPAEDSTTSGNESPVTYDPNVAVEERNLSLAIDTSQFGRTFQDRSHVFHIKQRPGGVDNNARIYNLNVRGKRGNIVQAYPATEYDFVPNILYARQGDYVHFQWTGCDTNPQGNAGEGTDQTDRSNIVQIANLGASYPANPDWIASHTALFDSKSLRERMAFIDQDPSKCKSYEQLLSDNNNNENNVEQDVGNCMKLNAADQYFDGGLIKMNKTGEFYYMSSRNNNFSNRGQKGTIIINPLLPPWAVALLVVGSVIFLGAAGVAGATLYARGHPHSKVAHYLNAVNSRI